MDLCHEKQYFGSFLFLLVLPLLIATSAATKSNTSIIEAEATASNGIISTSTYKSALSLNRTPITPLLSLPPPLPQSLPNISLLTFAWGHTTKYATILYNENVIVKGSNLLDIKYPENGDLNNYTIIGIYADATRADTATVLSAAQNVSIFIIEGGVGHKFATIRFIPKAVVNLEYNLKIYGVDI